MVKGNSSYTVPDTNELVSGSFASSSISLVAKKDVNVSYYYMDTTLVNTTVASGNSIPSLSNQWWNMIIWS